MSIFGGLAAAASRAAPGGLVASLANGRVGKRSGNVDDQSFFSHFHSAPSATGIPITQQTALQATAVMACVRILSEDVSKMSPGLFAWRADGGRTPVTTGPIADILWQPNDWQTWPEFCRQMVIAFALRSNAFAVIVRNGRGDPVTLVPINPDRVALWQSPDGSLFWLVTRNGLHELALLREFPLLIPYESVFHLKDLSADGLVGLSAITLAREAVALQLAYEQQQARLLGNGARPSGILSSDKPLSEDVAKRLQENWRDLHAGLFNTGQVAVLEAGLKWTPLSLTPADMQFLHLRQFQVIEICRMFRVPPHMVGDITRGTYQNLTQQGQEYRNNTLTSHSSLWERRFDMTFQLRKKGMFVDFDESSLLKADLTARYNAYRVGRFGGWLTRNEIRLPEGLPPTEDGDVFWEPTNMMPDQGAGDVSGSDSSGQAPTGAGKPHEPDGSDPEATDQAPGV